MQRLREVGGEQELRALLPLVTVGHTEFFRDPKQFRALERFILPQLLAQGAARDCARCPSGPPGCATGEEPYSVAMVMAELGALPMEVDLLGHRSEPGRRGGREAGALLGAALPRASRPSGCERFFRPVEEGMEVQPALREYIRFDGLNLAAPVLRRTWWRPARWI